MSKLVIYVCENFLSDFEKVVKEHNFSEVELVSYPYLCENFKQKEVVASILSKPKSKCNRYQIICGQFCPALNYLPDDDQLKKTTGIFCVDHMVNPELVRYIVGKGGYLVSSGWIKNWRKHIEEAGFNQENARNFYQEMCKELILLELENTEENEIKIKELSKYLNIPYTIIPVNSQYIESFLKSLVYEFRYNIEVHDNKRKLLEVHTQNAEYAAIIEVLQHIASYSTAEEVTEKIRELYIILFGAQEFVFTTDFSDKTKISPAAQKLLKNKEEEYILLLEEEKFLVKITRDHKVYGIMEIGGFLFPQYIEKYLNFAVEIGKISGLVFANNEQYQALLVSEKAAEDANLAKSQFLANMSHEIRTPLNGVMGMLQLLELTGLQEEQKEYVELSIRSSEVLQKVINDILEYSKIESGKVIFDTTEFSTRELLKDVRLMQSDKANRKGIKLETLIDTDVPERLIGDVHRIKQILTNLVGNAIKFTETGRIWISIKLKGFDNKGCVELEFEVGDTGIGISKEKLFEIFGFFAQADPSFTRKYGGTGLGLAISKGLVEQMGGSIWAESQSDKGSQIFFTIFLEQSYINSDQDSVEIKIKKQRSSRKLSLLIAEDDAISQLILKRISEREGWDSMIVSDGLSALEAFKKQEFDVVILDIQMPVMDGYQVARNIRNYESEKEMSRTPLIAMTAHALVGDREKCLEAGMDEYLSKPIDVNEFYYKVEALTAKHDRQEM